MRIIINIMRIIATIVLISLFAWHTPAHAATDIVNDGTLGTNVQGCWELDESSGTRVDETTNENDLTDQNTVLSTTGVIDSAADFELDNTEYLSILDGAQTGLDNFAAFTFAAFVNFETDPSSAMNFVSKYRLVAGGANEAHTYRFYSDGTNLTVVFWDGTTLNTESVAWNPAAATTYHVAVTVDTVDDEAKFYVNGSQQGTTQTFTANSIIDSTSAFALGASGQSSGDPEETLDGWMDVAAFWNAELTSTDISAVYNGGSGIPCAAAGGDPTVQTHIEFSGIMEFLGDIIIQ